jgi:hypothetical protein
MGEIMMIHRGTEGEDYISKFPKFRKWIRECLCCHTQGYDPAMPDQIGSEPSLGTYFIKKYYRPLALDENGFCESCSLFLSKNQ